MPPIFDGGKTMKDTKTKICFPYEGTDYVLEFTASSLKQMERQGFKFGKMDEIILTAPVELFCGAFIANHRATPRKLREKIYDELKSTSEDGGDDLTEVLGSMLSEAIEELNSHQGNVKWSVTR